jgi:hypothetical protein
MSPNLTLFIGSILPLVSIISVTPLIPNNYTFSLPENDLFAQGKLLTKTLCGYITILLITTLKHRKYKGLLKIYKVKNGKIQAVKRSVKD